MSQSSASCPEICIEKLRVGEFKRGVMLRTLKPGEKYNRNKGKIKVQSDDLCVNNGQIRCSICNQNLQKIDQCSIGDHIESESHITKADEWVQNAIR